MADIRSPIPGIFYRSPDPGAPPFKEEGDAVAAGETIGLVEVMKQFHEIKADADGTLGAFQIENEGTVDAGQTIVSVS